MKTKKEELNVDFIGGLGALTPQEEKALSDFFIKQRSTAKNVAINKRRKKKKQSKVSV